MNEETFKSIIRSIIDEHSDKHALDKIMYACEQQIAHIDYEEHINKY